MNVATKNGSTGYAFTVIDVRTKNGSWTEGRKRGKKERKEGMEKGVRYKVGRKEFDTRNEGRK